MHISRSISLGQRGPRSNGNKSVSLLKVKKSLFHLGGLTMDSK